MATGDYPSAAWQQPPSGKGSKGGGGFFRRTWRGFRRWPLWGQIATWVVLAFLVLVGI
jgi:hypothetical protein